VLDAHFDRLANDPGILGDGGTDQIRRQRQDGILVEVGDQTLLGQFDPVALDTGKGDFQRIPLGAHGLDLDGLARGLRLGHDRLGGEVEGDPEDIGILDIEQALPRSVRRTGGGASGR